MGKSKGHVDKPHASPLDTAENKQKFLAALAIGNAPNRAAKVAGVDRSTAFKWKKSDSEFEALWDAAVDASLDDVEDVLYKAAKAGEAWAIEFILKWRRKNVYQNTNDNAERTIASQTNYFLNAPLEEHYARLERLGLPAPVIEPDYEVIDAVADSEKDP
jgi:hypothetical protein